MIGGLGSSIERGANEMAITAGLKGARSGSSVLRPLHCPAGAHLGLGTAQAQLRAAHPRLTLKQPLLTPEARSGRGRTFS